MPRPLRLLRGPAKILTAVELATAALAALALTLMLAATPPFECGDDYASPTTPIQSGGIAAVCLAVALIGLLVGVGVALATPRGSADRPWVKRGIGAAVLAALLAGGAVFADLARWTCWP
jgi:hypothetical protein